MNDPAIPAVADTPATGVPAHSLGRAIRSGWVAVFFLWTSGIHVGIVAAGPELYDHFADQAVVPGLSRLWQATFVAHATFAGLFVATGEAALGLLLLGARTRRRVGWCGTIAFHLALMCFGWGFWLWCVPALALLLHGATEDWSDAAPPV
jgi:hypothetical protein